MSTNLVTCQCGAVYEREVQKDIVRDSDSFNCQLCGYELESWSTSRWPTFRLVSRPDQKDEPNV